VSLRTVRVLLPLPLADAYDYSVPDGLDVAPGHFVVVPLGKRLTIGVVWGEGTGDVAREKLRDIEEVMPALPMADALRRFVDWVSAYTLAPPGAVLRMAMSVPSALEAPKTEIVYRAAPASDDAALKLTAARRRVLEQLKEGPALLDTGKVTLSSVFDATSPIKIDRFTINDDHAQRRPLTVPELFKYSSNIASAKMAVEMGAETQRAFFEKIGFLKPLTTQLTELGQPLYPRHWMKINTMTIAFDRGFDTRRGGIERRHELRSRLGKTARHRRCKAATAHWKWRRVTGVRPERPERGVGHGRAGAVTGGGECGAQGADDQAAHDAGIAETHLGLGGMHVDVDHGGRRLEE